MKTNCFFALVICFIGFTCVAQTNSWWEYKYKVKNLEELGVEKLESEQIRYKDNKMVGAIMMPMGIGLSALGLNQTFSNMYSSGNGGAGLFIVGIGSFITGFAMLVSNSHRLNDIEKAINSFDSHSNLKINTNIQKYNSDIGLQISIRYRL